jgi:serine/threonine-protein kinase
MAFIVMELIEGISLKQYLNRKGALGWKEALHFAAQIAKAISHAHSRGIIHRDIKPHNIMIVKDGSVKVADFGIARLANTQHTVTQQTLGSVHYISPEQAKGENVTEAADIYSLGVVMYEMLTGKLPFEGDSAVAVAVAHINSMAVPPRAVKPDIPAGLESITMKAMSADLNERYRSADELLADIEEFRKTRAAMESAEGALTAIPGTGMNVHNGQPQYKVRRSVKPIPRAGELSKEAYSRNWTRSRKVSMLSGFGIVLFVVVVLTAFVWNYFLKGLFSDTERRIVPSFVGSYIYDIEDNSIFSFVTFTVISKPSDADKDVIIGQIPAQGKSVALTPEGISVQLIVSAGQEYNRVPDLTNTDFRDAKAQLEALGFTVELATVSSDSITRDFVVNTEPAAAAELQAGTVVKINVSGGPEINSFPMPSLIGLTEAQAKQKMESLKLSFEKTTGVPSDTEPEGTVVWQNIPAGENIEEHAKIYIQVSTGPRESPTPDANG